MEKLSIKRDIMSAYKLTLCKVNWEKGWAVRDSAAAILAWVDIMSTSAAFRARM